MKGLFIFPVLLILLFGTPAFAGSLLGALYHFSGDYESALKELKPLAEQGDASAQQLMGTMYNNGQGVTQNHKIAGKWFMLAADHKYSRAQFNLGQMYLQGLGVTQDYKSAVKWFRLAAEQGEAIAQNNLGAIYYLGNDVIQDYTRAHMWWNLAASQGDEGARSRRSNVESKMTPSQIEKAQGLAHECVAKNYKDC